MEKNRMPKELEEAVCKNELIVFVGAGLSYNLVNIKKQALRGWSNLVHQLLLYLQEEDYDVSPLIALVPRYKPIQILDLIESDSSIPKKKINEFIKDFLDMDDENDFNLHKKLYQLSNKIITTNYDNAFEKAIPVLKKNTAYKGRNYELTTHKESNASLLFKLHGCFEDVNSMVLFPKNYHSLYKSGIRDAEHSILVLRNIIMNKTILFVGTGMGDFQINYLFEEIKNLQGDYNQKHYIITKTQVDSSLHFLTHIPVHDYAEIEEVIDYLISIKEDSGNKETEKVKLLEEQLKVAETRIKQLESEKNLNQAKLLERESLKYFSKGVGFSMSGELEKSVKEYETASELNPDFNDAFYNWGTDLGNLAEMKEGAAADALYEQAFDKFQKAIEIKPDKHEAFNNWGSYLGNLAKTKEGTEGESLYVQAFAKFQKAIEIKPDKHEAFYNWGTYLGHLAEMKEGAVADSLYVQAFAKFQKAVEIKPDKHEAFYNWGSYLGHLAKTKEGVEADALYEQAFDKFQKAIEIKPDFYNAFHNWGIYLGNLAQKKEEAEADNVYEQAFDKFQKAIEIDPNKHESFYSWGSYLRWLAQTKEGVEAEALYEQAFDKFQKGIEYGGQSYNLACLYALTGKKEMALKYLNISLSNKEIEPDFVIKDVDWKNYYEDPDFIILIEGFKKGRL